MKLNNKFWLFAAICIVFTSAIAAALAVIFWRQLSPPEQQILMRLFKEQFWYFFSTAVFLFAAFGFTLDWFFRFYILPLNQLVEETRVMNTVNPAHRLRIDGSREIQELGELINTCGDQYLSARHIIEKTVSAAKAKTEAEKNILATIMAELSQGVLICDPVGRILLYNRQAQRCLDKKQPRPDESSGNVTSIDTPEGFVGLHRSVYSLIDMNLIQYALKEIQRKLDQARESVSSHFVVVTQNRSQLRVETLPILDEERRFAGFALIFSDITRQLEQSGRLNRQLTELTKSLRSATASIRSSVDLMIQFPEMERGQKNDFLKMVAEQTEDLSRILSNDFTDTSVYSRSRWPLSPILVTDFITTLKDETRAFGELNIDVDLMDARCLIRIDHFSLLLAIGFVMECLRKECRLHCHRLRLAAPGNLVQIDMIWQGPAVPIETLRGWCDLPLSDYQKGFPLAVKEVLEHHHAEIWPHKPQSDGDESSLRLFIPMVHAEQRPDDDRQAPRLSRKRSDFYDFDLFSQAGQTPELERRLLGELVYTVFDTETTGLDPRGGDEIISIGAIRLVNGRLLHTEIINQLVNPGRAVPEASIRYHGITDQMLKDRPDIGQALPLLHRFSQETVLVGHNVAFDMRMLQMKEQETGIRFINPVLDTMHLSAVVHPAHADHSLEHIAKRLGVSITRRHDALGDAIATGEIFIKLLSLLNEKGVCTLKDALLASQRTYYARMKY